MGGSPLQIRPMLGVIDGYAQVAQSVEHVLGKDEVGGSIPLLGFLSRLEFALGTRLRNSNKSVQPLADP